MDIDLSEINDYIKKSNIKINNRGIKIICISIKAVTACFILNITNKMEHLNLKKVRSNIVDKLDITDDIIYDFIHTNDDVKIYLNLDEYIFDVFRSNSENSITGSLIKRINYILNYYFNKMIYTNDNNLSESQIKKNMEKTFSNSMYKLLSKYIEGSLSNDSSEEYIPKKNKNENTEMKTKTNPNINIKTNIKTNYKPQSEFDEIFNEDVFDTQLSPVNNYIKQKQSDITKPIFCNLLNITPIIDIVSTYS
jgi:hypothetical protein